MRIRDKVTNLLPPVKQNLSRLRSGKIDPSSIVRSSTAPEPSGDLSQLPGAQQRQILPAEVSSPSQPVTSRDVVLSNTSGELVLQDLAEESLIASNLSLFTSAAIGAAKALSNLYPPLGIAVVGLLIAVEGFEKAGEIQDDFAYAAQKLVLMKATYVNHRSELDSSQRLKGCLEVVVRTIDMIARMLKDKSDRGIFKRIWEYPSDVRAVSKFIRMLGDVADHFVMNVIASTYSMVQDQILDKLAFVESAQFLSIKTGRQCTEGTRTELLTNLMIWATTSSGAPKICLLNGPAGSGKSTIAHTVCSFLRGLDLLGGSFFCSRDDDENRRSTQSIFSTLARSLASHDREYASALVRTLRNNVGAGSFVAKEQLTNLILAPMRDAHFGQKASALPVRVLVIDALDECIDEGKALYDLMCTLLAEVDIMPLKFLITSRPDFRINKAFERVDPDCYALYRIEDIPENTARDDVLTYLQSELNQCAKACHAPQGWPPATLIETLAKQAGMLFIYASTACKYIWNLDDDVAHRLEELTTPGAPRLDGIDSMYEFVLGQVRRSKSDATWDVTRRCLQTIVCLRRPLSLGDLADLLDVDCQRVRIALAGLQSVVSIPSSDHPAVISVFHASFSDYLTDVHRSHGKPWSLDGTVVHSDMLHRCLSVMMRELRFNVSNSCTSYASNTEQPTKHSISGALHYSCVHWIDHLEGCGYVSSYDIANLGSLLSTSFLYWLEVLSTMSSVRVAPFIMTRLLSWMREHHSVLKSTISLENVPEKQSLPWNLQQFAYDAIAFMGAFSVPIETSCPHIYISALASTPKQSKIWLGLSTTFDNLPSTITLQPHNIAFLLVLRGHENGINSVEFSSDGTLIVSGSDDRTIRLWDVTSGTAIGQPLSGHTGWISSVAFSPDGSRIVSGSWDRTMRLWNVATGAAIGGPLHGHEKAVLAVKFSPDGKRVASCSGDKTIRLWHVGANPSIEAALRGHEDGIRSIEFSPDGTRIISGSDDQTIRLWDVATGAAIGEPLHGHENWVTSVAFSADGTRVISGSWDRTIRLWDVYTGAAIGEPLRGHADGVLSVAFSRDGAQIISGSADQTIRLWDASTGLTIGEALRGHENRISSVAFSPDGSRIISGSWDQTICLRDAATGEVIRELSRSHSKGVSCVAFSPDGTLIVSGSWDQTICLWDIATGAAISTPLHGHEDWIRCVAFSPDGTSIVSGSEDQTIRLWDLSTGAAIGGPLCGHKEAIISVAFSPAGERIISSSFNEIYVWDATTRAVIEKLVRDHDAPVLPMVFSPDGTGAISTSQEKPVLLWHLATRVVIGDHLRGYGERNPHMHVALSPDGMRMASGYSDHTIRLWDVSTGADVVDSHRYHISKVCFSAASPHDVVVFSSGGNHILKAISCLPFPESHRSSDHDSDGMDPQANQTNFAQMNHSRENRPPLGPVNRVAFSQNDTHFTYIDDLVLPDRDPRETFSLGQDGWLRGPDGQLFLWILPEYRRGLWWPRMTTLIGTHPVMLDLSRFFHGNQWTRCFAAEDENCVEDVDQ